MRTRELIVENLRAVTANGRPIIALIKSIPPTDPNPNNPI